MFSHFLPSLGRLQDSQPSANPAWPKTAAHEGHPASSGVCSHSPRAHSPGCAPPGHVPSKLDAFLLVPCHKYTALPPFCLPQALSPDPNTSYTPSCIVHYNPLGFLPIAGKETTSPHLWVERQRFIYSFTNHTARAACNIFLPLPIHYFHSFIFPSTQSSAFQFTCLHIVYELLLPDSPLPQDILLQL